MKTTISQSHRKTNALLRSAAGITALVLALPLLAAERGGGHDSRGGGRPGGGPPAGGHFGGGPPGGRPGGGVERFNHGSVRHSDSHVFRPPTPSFPRPGGNFEVRPNFGPRHDFFVHRDVDVDIHRPHFWNDFAFHRRFNVLPPGFLTLNIGGAPYYYSGGIYYQPFEGGYQEVYPPVGAAIPQPPDGSIQVYAGGQTYYYAGGAFYVQQPDGQFVIAPTPMGVVVPELPPGAVEVNVNGELAYQFNGIYYRPVFVNGVTQYETFAP